MVGAGITLVESLECLLKGMESGPQHSKDYEGAEFRYVLEDIAEHLNGGRKLSESLSLFPKVFSPLYIAMIKVGEETGGLVSALSRLSDWLERADRTRRKVRSALTYPAFMLAVCLVLAGLLFLLIAPQFEETLRQSGAALPFVTRLVFSISDVVRSPGAWLLLTALTVAAISLLMRTLESKPGRLKIFRVLHWTPVLGSVLNSASLARFCSAAEMSVANGIDLVRGVKLAVQASANPLIENDWEEIKEALIQGVPLSDHLGERKDIYDGILVLMVAAGEETGNLEKSFSKAAQIFEDQVEDAIERLSSVIEPLLLVGVGSMVGCVLIAVALPMYSVISGL